MAHVTLSAPAQSGLFARVARMLDAVKVRYTRYQIFRTTLAEMQGLSERELADLGLSRSMVRRAAYEAAYG